MKLGSFSTIAAFVEEEEFRGLEFVTRGKRRVVVARVAGRYLNVDTGEPFVLTIEQATRPCWRATNDV